jgi:glycosyltransferase involved in cell wall biosynthesis
MFCTDLSLIPFFSGKIIVDLDDPALNQEEIAVLNSPNVEVVVTTTDLLKRRLQDLGLHKPCKVIASGVDWAWIEQARSRYHAEIMHHDQSESSIRLCFVTPKLLTKEEAVPGSETYGLRTVDFLLAAMREVWKTHSEVQLWLIGNPSPKVREISRRYPQIKLWGYVSHHALADIYVRAHIGLYPRIADFKGRHSIKIIEYMAAGLPVVSTQVGEAFHIERSEAGLLAATYEDFAEAIVSLVENPDLRRTMAERGIAYSRQFDWQRIANRYQLEILNAYAGQATDRER